MIYVAETIKNIVENIPMSLKQLNEEFEKGIKNKTDVADDVIDITNMLKENIDRLIEPERDELDDESTGTPFK